MSSSAADDVDYHHARYMNPQIARYLSFDPVGGAPRNPQSWNRYSYVLGNPIKFIDPFGLSAINAGFGETITVRARDPRWDAFTMWLESEAYFAGYGPSIHRYEDFRATGMTVREYALSVAAAGGTGACDWTCQVLGAAVRGEVANATEWLEFGITELTGTWIGARGFSLLGRGAAALLLSGSKVTSAGYTFSAHAAGRMAEYGVSESMVNVALRSGTRYWDPGRGSVLFISREGFASGHSLVVAVDPATKTITTLMKGSRVISSRIVPLVP